MRLRHLSCSPLHLRITIATSSLFKYGRLSNLDCVLLPRGIPQTLVAHTVAKPVEQMLLKQQWLFASATMMVMTMRLTCTQHLTIGTWMWRLKRTRRTALETTNKRKNI